MKIPRVVVVVAAAAASTTSSVFVSFPNAVSAWTTTAVTRTASSSSLSSRRRTVLNLATDMMMTEQTSANNGDADDHNSSGSTTKPKPFTSPFPKPQERIVMDDLPTLFVYDHCPFCVRVRVALGLKNIKHNLHFLANDDVATPTSLVGKKIAPIFVRLNLFCIVCKRESAPWEGSTFVFFLFCLSSH